jgi:nucleoside-diphosphate-sugar epimerase
VLIAVTGGLGRLGRYVLNALAPHQLRVIDVATPPASPPDATQLQFQRIDLRDLPALCAALASCEAVVHLGGIDRSFATDDAVTMQVNAIGTWNLLEASRRSGIRRVVLASSSSATGLDQSNPSMPPCYLPIDEAHPLRPTDAYGLSKCCVEVIGEAFSRRGLDIVALRPCLIAFPEMAGFMAGRDGPDGRAEPMPYLRAYVGPEDCARGFAAAVAMRQCTAFETFFLAAHDCFASEPTIPRLEALYQARIPIHDADLYAASPRASPISSRRARERLGWVASTSWDIDRAVMYHSSADT